MATEPKVIPATDPLASGAPPAPSPEPAPVADVSAAEHADDGFTPEERAQFAEMQAADSQVETVLPAEPAAPAAGDRPDGGKKAAVAPGAPAAASAGDDDSDDDDEPGEGAGAAAGQGAADGAGQRNPKRVSYGKFKRTEDEAKRLRGELATAKDTLSRGDERLRILSEALTAPKPGEVGAAGEDADPEPDAEADVFGWIKWSGRQRQRLEGELAELRSGRQAEKNDTTVANAYMSDARNFAAQEPNFVPAYTHLMESRTAELALYFFGKDLSEEGVQLTQQEHHKIAATAAEEEKQLVESAIRNNQSPAARIFKLARARGYRPGAPAAANAAAAAADGAARAGGAAPAGGGKPTASAQAPGALGSPAAAGGAAPSVKEEIDRIRAGQDASVSLSNGGGSPANPFTVEKLANMPQDKFNEMVENMSPEEFRRLVEGNA